MPNTYLVTKNFGETFYIIAGVTFVHFAIATKFAAHQIINRFNAQYQKAVRHQFYEYFTVNGFLCVGKKSFHIAHNGVMKLPFMQPISVKQGKLIFPIQLPFGKRMFF